MQALLRIMQQSSDQLVTVLGVIWSGAIGKSPDENLWEMSNLGLSNLSFPRSELKLQLVNLGVVIHCRFNETTLRMQVT